MANSKISDLPEKTSIANTDYVPIVDESGAPASKKITALNFLKQYNVKMYGAVGDNSTDDTTAIQNTINAANSAGGGIVFFPVGVYKLTSALTGYSNISYVGAASSYQANGGSCLNQTTSNVDAITFTNTTNKTSNVVISNLRIQGPGTTTGNGIYLKNTGHSGSFNPFIYFSIRDVYIADFNGTGACGVNMEGPIVTVLEKVVSETCNIGFYLNGAAGGSPWDTTCTSVTFNACYANGCQAGTGFKIKNTVYTTLNNCAADACGTAYLIDTCNNIVLNGCGSEWNNPDTATPGDGFKITGCNFVTLNSPYTFQNFHYSFWITGNSDGITLIGPAENSPVSATNSLKVDSGSHCTSINIGFTTARSEAAFSSNILDDATGSAVIPGPIYMGKNISLAAGTAATGGAPLYFQSGASLTATADGAMEYDGSHIYFSIGTGRHQLDSQSGGGITGPTGPTGRFPAITSVATASSPTPNSDTTDIYEITAQNVTGAFQAPSGSPVDGQKLIVQITPSGTGQSMTWSTTGYTGTTTVSLPTTTGTTGKMLNVGFMYVTANSLNKWMCVASIQQ